MTSEAATPASSLVDSYVDWLKITIDKEGVRYPHGILIDAKGEMTVCVLAVPPADAYRAMLVQWIERSGKEMIFALDRYALPDQGTTLRDLMAGHHFVRGERRSFIIEYQHEPRLVKPIDFNNAFWNQYLRSELLGAIRNLGAEMMVR